MRRRPLRKFPDEWFTTETVTPTGGSEPREDGFNRATHGQELLAGIRQAYLSKPKNPLASDPHVYFAARTWKDRPSLRRNLENIKARVHRILADGTVVGSWKSKEDYDESKAYVSEYQRKHTKAADLDFVESIKGLDHKDKLGRSLLEVLENEDVHREGQLSLVFYPDYSEAQVKRFADRVEQEYGGRGIKLVRLIPGLGRVTAVFHGPLHLSDELANRVEAVAVIEQIGELRPAGPAAQSPRGSSRLTVAIRRPLPEVGVFDTGTSGDHPFLQGVILSGDPKVDHVDAEEDGGHGTFVAGIIAYGEDPESRISNNEIQPRALIHPRRVALANIHGGMNLDNYEQFSKTVEQLRKNTRVFTASLSERIPIDSDSISPVAINIDLISDKYGVLFVLPMGNLPNIINNNLSPAQPNYSDIPSWCSDPNARMGRPGEAFNALTVSSLVERQVGNEWATPGEVAPYTRRGPGPKGFPKPDLAAAGGNCVVTLDSDDPFSVGFELDDHPKASMTGLCAPEGTMKSFGTSFAVPKIAFALARLVAKFDQLADKASAALLAKAYLIHISRLPNGYGPLPEDGTSNAHLLYGYGVPDQDALDGVLPSELCFFASEEIGRRQRHVYSLKFPANVLNSLPDVLLRVTLAYFAKVDATAVDAELYSQIDITAVVRWGGKTLTKIPRGAPLADFYPLKSFEVKFSKPREGRPADRGQPTVEVLMKDRVLDVDDLKRRYSLLISVVSPSGDVVLHDLVQEIEPAEE